VQETARTGGTDLVHIEIKGMSLIDPDVLGILAADFKNGVDFRVDRYGAPCMRRDFIDDEIGIQEIPHHVAPGPGRRHRQEPHPAADFPVDGLQQPLGDLDGLSLRGHVAFVQDLPLVVDQGILG